MKEYQMQASQEQPAIQLKPIISYPRVAEIGETYLLTIDVQLATDSPWPYQEEEFEISFLLETAPFFTHEALGPHEPGIVLHRFGGTYGAAEYLLTASNERSLRDTSKLRFLMGGACLLHNLSWSARSSEVYFKEYQERIHLQLCSMLPFHQI